MSIQTFFKSLTYTFTPRQPIRRNSVTPRLRLESVEDRCLLSFSPAVMYPAGTIPEAVLTADFNGDGRLDLAVANYSSSNVSVLLGNGNGTFQPAENSATGTWPVSLSVGDFNADGKLDLATANSAYGDVSVLLGNGNGTFQAPINLGSVGNPTAVAVGDFNADGNLDLGVTTNGIYGEEGGSLIASAAVLLGDGNGSFAAPYTAWLGSGWHTSAVVADFNGDGNLDFAALSADYGSVDVAFGDGTGTFGGPVAIPVGSAPYSVAAGDVNADGKIDLVTASEGNNVSVLLSNGLGSFGAAQNYAVGANPSSVAMADFNGDGKIDLVTANEVYNDAVSVLLGTGLGSFGAAQHFAVGVEPKSLAVGDFNGDLFLDVAVANERSDNVSVLLNDGTWTLPPPPPPSITTSDVTVTEGNSGTRAAKFTVTLSAASSQPVSVAYSTANGTATAGSDFQAASGVLTIPVGQTTGTIIVPVNGDRLAESSETFVINLSSPTNATIADGQSAGTIVDDEPRIIIGDVMLAEGKKNQSTLFTFTVTLSAAYDQPVTMSFHTVDGTAKTNDGDYVAKTGTLTFAPGQTTKTITIEVKGDSKREANETFYLDLSGLSSNGLFTKNRGVGTILNDD